MTWGSEIFQGILVFGLFVVLGCLALFVDYLKSYNDQLRERNVALAARQQERDKWFGASPEAFAEKIAGLLRGSQLLPAPAPAVAGATVRHRTRGMSRPPLPSREAVGQAESASEAAESAEPPVEAAQPVLSPRARARREAAQSEGWVSKEELERLAERAARIRARYGNMQMEEAAQSAEREPQAAQESVVTGAPAEAAPLMRQPEPPAEFASPEPAGEPERVAPAPEFHEVAEAPVSAGTSSAPMPEESGIGHMAESPDRGDDERPPVAAHAFEDRFEESPEPVWGLPASPAQAAISAAVAPRPAASEEPASFASVEQLTNEPHDPELNAMFDQTYGSPAWLAHSESAAVPHELILPTGLFEGDEVAALLAEAPSFTGIAVSIRINDFALLKAKLNSVEGVEAMTSLSNLIRSLLREDRDFAGKAQEDEYVLLFPGETGDEGQRRLFHLSERLWDFQLRSLGGLSLMLSWGGLEVDGRPVPEAINAARDRLEESRRGRARPGTTFRSARRAS